MTRSEFHRGIRLHGEVLREARLALGLRQVQLAKQAGIAERTVRKAESGQVVEKYIADYICKALELPFENAIQAEPTKRRTPSPRMKALRFERDFQKALLENDPDSFLAWLHPEVHWSCHSPVFPATYLSASGRTEAMDLARTLQRWLDSMGISNRRVRFTRIHNSGNILYAYSHVRLAVGSKTDLHQNSKQRFHYRSAKLIYFEDGLIRNFDHFWAPIHKPTKPTPSPPHPFSQGESERLMH